MSIQLELDDTKIELFLAIAQNYHSTNTLECDLLDDIARIIRGEKLYGYEGVRRIEQPGAGIQSTTLALMAMHGLIEKPQYAIFADTGLCGV